MAKILVAFEGVAPVASSIVQVPKAFFSVNRSPKFTGVVAADADNAWKESKEDDLAGQGRLQQLAQKMRAYAFESGLKVDVLPKLMFSSNQIVEKTPFKDLMVMDYKACFNFVKGEGEDSDSSELFNVLRESQCPILILPEQFEKVEHVVFCYDGRDSSLFAIKHFSVLFAKQLRDKVVTVLTVDPEEGEGIANEKELMGYLTHHFTNVGVKRIQGEEISQEIYDFSSNLPDPLLVMGAYGRTQLSHTLVPSVARGIIFRKKLPVFITHK
ncbi:MAG: universal stress protein [Cytophagales bacterium]|nr:universal stress protein [Cytophagales bacterium]